MKILNKIIEKDNKTEKLGLTNLETILASGGLLSAATSLIMMGLGSEKSYVTPFVMASVVCSLAELGYNNYRKSKKAESSYDNL